jgi:phospholipase D1/2
MRGIFMQTSLLQEGKNCWKITTVERLSVLVDAAAFYAAFARVAEHARESILILAWDIDWRTRLNRESDETFAQLLLKLVKRNPYLHINILEWDFAMIYARERGILPMFGVGVPSHRRIHYHKDEVHPLAGSHHQKIIVIDDHLSFCGGLDITRQRWDTPEHKPADPRRIDPSGIIYEPFHDVHLMMQGEASKELGKLARQRWHTATRKKLKPPTHFEAAWPDDIEPHIQNTTIGISRTEPPYGNNEGVFEIKNLFADIIASAKKWLYIESQYLTSSSTQQELAKRLADPNCPEILIAVPLQCSGWLEKSTMGVIRARLLSDLTRADRFHKLRVCYPVVEEAAVMVHSKVMIADNDILSIGSANLSNRSMGLDTECNIAVEAAGSVDVQNAIGKIRNELLAEHLGMKVEEVESFLEKNNSLIELIESKKEMRRHLEIYAPDELQLVPSALGDADLVDPEQPIDLERWVVDFVPETEDRIETGQQIISTGLFFAAIVIFAACWYWTPMRQYLDPVMLGERTSHIKQIPLLILAVIAGYTAGSLILFPITVLLLVTIFLFDSIYGIAYGIIGATGAAAFTYWIGHLLGRNRVRRIAGKKLNRITKLISKRGLLTIVVVRLLPIAPFSIVNIVAGASRILFFDFIIGTVIGLLPGLLGMSLFEASLKAALINPSPLNIMILIAVVGTLLVVAGLIKNKLEQHKESTKAQQYVHT